MIRVVLPAHLRTLAQVNGEVHSTSTAEQPKASSLTRLKLNTRFCVGHSVTPTPNNAEHSSDSLRAKRTSPTEPADAPLPAAVIAGAEPFIVLGAMAGG